MTEEEMTIVKESITEGYNEGFMDALRLFRETVDKAVDQIEAEFKRIKDQPSKGSSQ